MPTVSVIIPSYNHEKFVEECIQSVLDQTFSDFEIVITDDGSSDQTVQIIESFNDPRIKLFKHSKNMGACVAANNSLLHASGKYVAVLSSDDAWYPEKLEVQVEYLNEHPEIGVVFGKVEWVDEYSNPITDETFSLFKLFEVKNRSRHEWLNYFFCFGNCLCHPCSLVRRECYDEVGRFNPAYASLPDLDFWIRICLKYEIKILDQKLIRFRKISDQSNASGHTFATLIRNQFEHRHSLSHYLSITDPEELMLIFPDADKYGEVTIDTIPYLLGRIAIDTNIEYKILWGLDVIYSILMDENLAKILESKCSFRFVDFIELSGKYDTFKIMYLPQPLQVENKSTPLRMILTATKNYVKILRLIALRLASRR